IHEVYRGAFGTLEGDPSLLALVRFGLSLVALGPATVLMGATLPTLTRYLSRDPSELSGSFGKLYAANTIGAILGTIAAGFVLSGLAAGALAWAWLRTRVRDPISLLALGQILVAVLVIGGMAAVISRHITEFLPLTTHFGKLFTGYVAPVVFVVLPATFVMGL